jgi:DNA-binding NtrC family response regulator
MSIRHRVLVVDDRMGKDQPTEFERLARADYCRALGLRDEALAEDPAYPVVADAHVCSGQVAGPAGPVNSIEAVEKTFRKGWPAESGRYWSAALVDMKFGDDAHFGLRVIERLNRLAPDLPVIVVSSLNQLQVLASETLREAVHRLGAEDFLAAPGVDFDVDPLYRSTPENLRARLDLLGLSPDPEQQVVGYSLAICRVLKEVRKYIPNDSIGELLLLGESGSGKSHLLGYVRRQLARQQGRALERVPHRHISLSGTSDEMQKKSLFGTTEATGVKPVGGAFEDCRDGGVIFLDEIGELTQGSQGDLLLALQPVKAPDGSRYRKVLRMGGKEELQSRSFVLAATNRNLSEMVTQDRFSEALLQRFASIELPPLRERKGDLPLLVNHFLHDACQRYEIATPRLDVPLDAWQQYAEGHSVRELQKLIEATTSGNRFRTLFTERDFFRERTRAERGPEPELRETGAEPIPDSSEDTVTALTQIINSWQPGRGLNSEECAGAFPKLDTAIAHAKLRLWRHLVEKQKVETNDVNLLHTVRRLLGKQDIPNSKPGDLALQIFKDGGIDDRPDDPVLAEIWDRRRGARRLKRTGTGETE